MFSSSEFSEFLLRLEEPDAWDSITVRELDLAFEYVCNNYEDLEDPDAIYDALYTVRRIK